MWGWHGWGGLTSLQNLIWSIHSRCILKHMFWTLVVFAQIWSSYRKFQCTKACLNVRVSIIREIALTYISCVFHRSVASASRRVCSRRVDASCHDAPPGLLGCRSPVDSSLGVHCYGQSGSRWISLWQSATCERLSLWTFCEEAGGRGLPAPSASPTCSCRGCVAGDWRVKRSSHSGRGCETRASGSSLRPVSWSNLTGDKTAPLDLDSGVFIKWWYRVT